MSFKKKFWKKGDKLTVKELNRIEKGIAESGSGLPVVECDLDATTGEASNFSITSTDLTNLIINYTRITLKVNVYAPDDETNTLEQVGLAWMDTAQIRDSDMIFNTFSEGQMVTYILQTDKDSGEIKFTVDD